MAKLATPIENLTPLSESLILFGSNSMNKIKLKSFYESSVGNNIMEKKCFSEEINQYLEFEKCLLESIINKFNVLVEIGCVKGRHLQWALDKGKYYVGIDIVNQHILDAREVASSLNLDSSQYKVVCEQAENFYTILNNLNIDIDDKQKYNTLIYFPFNILGNVENFEQTIMSLKESNVDFYISAFKTDNFSTKIRKNYYNKCGCKDIIEIQDDTGIRFKSKEGLNTIAYFPNWLNQKFFEMDIKIKTYEISKVGIAYISDRQS